MAKITLRIFLMVLLCGLFSFSGSTVLPKILYGPEKPALKDNQQNTFFVGFLLVATPTITAPENKTVVHDSGQCYASNVDLGTPTITGTSNSPEISIDGNNIDPSSYQFQIGSTTLTWTITNEDGSDSDTQIVTVTDNEKPVITHNGDQNVNSDAGTCGAAVTVSASASDNCTVGNPTGIRSDGLALTAAYPVGSTTVTWNVTDTNNNDATTLTQTVTVTDNEKPVITHNGDQNVNSDAGTCGAAVTVSASATDNCTVGNPTGTRSDGLALTAAYPVGSTTVTWNVTDTNNNDATTLTQTVTVTDNEKPVITHNGDQNVNSDAGTCGAAVTVSASATDNCTVGNPTGTRSDGLALTAAYPVGSTTVTWNVTDTNNNDATTLTQTVTVTDNEKPVITHNGHQNVNSDAGTCGAAVTVSASATDNCTVGNPTGSRSDNKSLSDPFPIGETIITWNATDIHNNPAESVTQKVIVTDNEAPIVPELNDITWGCNYTVAVPVAIDNCDNEITGTANRSTTFNSSGEIIWTFTDAAANVSTVKQIITINPVSVSIQKQDIVCFDAANGIAEAIVSGGVAPFTYDWGTAGTTGKIENLTPGDYSVTVTDANGCDASAQVTITQPDQLQADFTSTNVTCSGNQDGSITISGPTGGFGNYEYSINSTNWQQSGTFPNLNGGSYSVQIRDAQHTSCVVILESNLVVEEPQELAMTNPNPVAATCFGASNGTATAGTVSGGNGDYQYSIDNTNFSTSTTFEGLPAGIHTIFVKDSKGCSLQKTVTITEPAVLNATVTRTNVSCFDGNDGKITITGSTGGSGNFEYSINGSTWQTSGTFSGLEKGIFNVQIRDKNVSTCVILLKENYQITQPDAPLTVEVTTTRTTTYGTATGSATANPSGGTAGYTYEWRKVGESTILNTTKTVNNFAAGNYTLTVIDSKGCRIEKPFEIIDALEAFIVSRSICESIEEATDLRTSYFEVENLTAVGGVAPYEYTWNFGTDATNPERSGIGEHQVFFSEIGNKTVTLTVTDFDGKELSVTQSLYVGKCYEPCGKSENIVFDPENFYVGDSNGNAIDLQNNCSDVGDKFIYLKVDKSANAYNPYVELVYIIRNNQKVDTHFIKGCRTGNDIDEDLTINQDNKIGEYIRFTLDPIDFKCGDNVDIDNFYITWTNVSKKGCGQNNNAFCYSIDDPIIIPTSLLAEATANEILCKGDASGIINVEVSGGFAPYTYSLTESNPNYQTNSQFINLLAGSYTVYVKDARSNKTSVNVTILEPTSSVTATISTTPPICFGETGEATVAATGGTGPYTYLWNDPENQTTETAYDLVAGNYTVTVIDANGCQTIETVTITEPEQLTSAEAGEDQNFNCGFNSTILEANTPVTGVGTWTIITGTEGIITDVNSANSVFTGEPGTYTLQWTIANEDGSCSTTDEVNITFVDDCSTLDFDGVDDHIVFGNEYGLSTGTFSMEAWVKLKSTNGVKTILSKRNMRNPGEGGYDLVINQGAPTFRWGNSSVSSSAQLGTQRWYHVAVIFKDSRANLYVDGIRVGNTAATNPGTTSFPFLIGAEFDNNNPEIPQNFFHGWIEEVRIWKTALTEEQLRFMMNQRLEVDITPVKGDVLPMNVPGDLEWVNLDGYYQLLVNEASNGITRDKAATKIDGELKNITTPQKNTAPLPYVSEKNGEWKSNTTWDTNSGNEELKKWWTYPNDVGINGAPILWNIAKTDHDITSGGYDINVLGLISEGNTLTVSNPTENQDWQNSGQALRVSHYLKLNGNIILVGESQLVQTDIKTAAQITKPAIEFAQSITSVLEESSSGYIERAQQGTENSFNYNYWSSPVSLQGAANNSTYTVKGVMLDGSATANYGKVLDFHDWHEYADYTYAASAARRVSNYWINVFRNGPANQYSAWSRIGSTGTIKAGEGYTMKGTSGNAAISDSQNYVFKGKPNNGTITLNIDKDQNYLLGNPYPSAIDANKFILDNLNASIVSGATNTRNIFNGALYFWDHFAGKSHILLEYIGGYATRNLTGGVPAASTDERINANDQEGTKIPGQFIPVAQGFFINTVLDPELSGSYTVDGGDVLFKNSQRAFVTEKISADSQFLRPENPVKENKQVDTRSKIRLDFRSPMGYHRQILVGVDPNATDGFDLGYDAALNDSNLEDMYWLIDEKKYVIQGVSNFDLNQNLKLGVRIEEEGELLIKINKLENISEEVNIYLKDKADSTYHDLRKSDFKLNLEKGEIKERFEIVFQKEKDPAPEPDPDPIEEPNTDLPETLPPGIIDVIFAENEHQLKILNPYEMNIEQVEIYNMLGQQVESFTSKSNKKEIIVPVRKHPAAIYVVKVSAIEGKVSKNILLMR